MKKAIITLTAIIMVFFGSAQSKVKIGLQITGAQTFSSLVNNSIDVSSKPFTWLSPALVSTINIGKNPLIKTGIGFTKGGYDNQMMYIDSNGAMKPLITKIFLNNINIPINLNIPFKLKDNKLLFQLGPSISYAINGNVISNRKVLHGGSDDLVKGPLNFTGNEIRRTNFLGHLGIGYLTRNGLEANIHYALGLNNMMYSSNNLELRNNNIGLGLAYYFIKF